MSDALTGVIGLAAGWAWACLAADLFFLLRVCGVVRVCRRSGVERAVCECVAV